ncbi:hypothetical protein [Duganella phyllosphaerae]|uniref:Uncharacterized protein n=1 Tax=Duganella phyllosphaerae TaxID=762836 RepID=A0A1E7W688_9BURK|nr:hypothetical protein [Duganella phyllosphaerae]OEZ91455.1 hypothetical protein DUPY_50670 [Duganella phyllosphaerae]
MPDIASLGLEINSKQVVEGTRALDALGAAAAAVEPKIDSVTKASDGLSQASAKVWRFGADATKGMDALGEATQRTGQRYQVSNGQMDDTAKILRQQAEEARATAQANTALGRSTTQMTLGQQLFIDKLRDQVAVLGMSRSQLLAYQAAELGVTKETEALIAKMKQFEDAAKAAGEAAKAAAAAKREQERSALTLSSALGLLVKGYAALKVAEYIKESALLAARYETLGVVVEVVGRNAGYTKTQMDTATDAIARQGITMVESRESATKLVQAHVDLKNATVLARIAQDAAVIGHLNSSDAFDRLVNGISRGNVLILRNIGINVNLQTAYREMADELGKTTKELTENERGQARLNAVIERGADIAGTYEAAMGTAGKQITSMQRYVTDLKTVVGEAFLEVLTVSVMALTDHLKDANKEVSELSTNQQLHEWGRTLADVFVWVANRVANATTLLQQGGALAGHLAKIDSINSVYDEKVRDPKTQGDFLDFSGRSDRIRRVNSERENMLAQEQVGYLEHLAKLSSQYDQFQKAADEREKNATAKKKAELEARLKVDQDYASRAAALLVANAGKPVAVQQAAQMALANSVYVGTPTYRDTEGREPKPKVDKVESTELADRLARIQDQVNAEKEMYETMSKMDDMFHSAGKMGDEQYYKNKRDYAEAAAKDQIDGYNKQIADLKSYHNATAAEAAKHAKQINDIEAKRAAADAKAQDEMNLLGTKEILRKEAIASASDEATNKYLSGLDQEAKKLEDSNAARETSKGAVERETVARLDLAIAYQKEFMAGQVAAGATAEEIAQAPATLKYLEDVRAARARIAAGLDQQQAIQFKDKAADQAIKDWQRAGQSISESLTSAFGEGGKAIGEMFQAYAKGMEGQLRAQKKLKDAKAQSDDNPEKIEAINRAQLEGTQAQIQSYAGMTSAAQGFFSEGSRGYQAMHAATVALQSAEIALSLIKGVNAVLTQGEGDPYTAFARMAAMAALVAGLGVAISGGGGGGGQKAVDVQKLQGTGSVFGDSSAKSDSIRRSIEQLTANSDNMLPINQGMLSALRNIESSMAGLTNLVVRTPGLTDGSNLGIQTGVVGKSTGASIAAGAQAGSMVGGYVAGPVGMVIGAIGGAIVGGLKSIWGKTTQNIVDSGLQYGGSVRGLQAGDGFDQYASIDTTKKSYFGLKKSTSNSVQTQGLSDELSAQFGLIFTNLDKSLQAASVALGGSAADVTKVLDSLTLESTKVSLKDLKGEELTAAINSVISKSMDEIAQAAFPAFDAFRKVGEGYAETVMRLAGDYAKLDAILAGTSTTFGATGVASVKAREHLIELAGGIDELASKSNSFAENFLSKAEQLAPVQKYVTDQLAAMGLQSLDTRDKFKDYVLGLANGGKLATDAGAAQYTALLALADAFAKTHAATVDLSKSEQEIADQRTDLQNQLDELTMTQAQLAAKARKEIDVSNLKLYDELTARKALAAAYETQSEALKTSIDKLKTFASAIKSFRDGLVLGNLSTLTLAEKAAAARDQYSTTLGAARGGDATAQSGLSAAATAFLTASQAGAASRLDYVRDYARVQADMAILAASVGGQLTDAEKQQASLDKQVKGLITLNDSVNAGAATVAQAIASLGVLGVKQIDGSHAGGLSRVPFDGYTAELHSGERVLTAFEAREYSARSSGGGTGDVAAAIDRLTEENRALRAELSEFKAQSQAGDVAVAQSVGKLARLADRWDANGLLVRADEPIPTREVVTA